MENSISLIVFLNTLKKQWKLIGMCTLAAGILSGLITNFVMTPIYQATTQILVNQKNAANQLDLSQFRNNVDFINTYSSIIKSPAILEGVISKLGLTQSVEQLNQNITISSQENSQVFSLVVEYSNPERAVQIANTISETFQQEIPEIMNIDNVKILAKAKMKDKPMPVNPKPFLNISVGLVVGLMMGVGLSLLLKILDNTVKDEQDVLTVVNLPVLGSIQIMTELPKKDIKSSKVKQVGSDTFVSYSKK